jgi:outer membrane biogenesis lipoprotein LolB
MKVMALVGAGTAVLFLAACGSPAAAPPAAPASPAAAKATSQAPAEAATTTKPAPEKTVAPVKMPNAIGMVLQDAQDLLQKVTGNPLYVSKSHDLLSTRLQVLDSGWQVCTQSVKKGKAFRPDTTTVDFGVVKVDESCP